LNGLELDGFRSDAALVGRDADLEVVAAFLDEASADGAALLISGEPGVGKTVLLDAAQKVASAAGMRVLRAGGVEFEAEVSFSGLNQALLPVHDYLERLSPLHKSALSAALGLGAAPASDRLVVSSAALSLLREVAASRPLLLIVDDLPWLDRASAAVLGIVARRLNGSRIGFLGASRSGSESFFERAGFKEHYLRPISDEAASDLVAARFPTLALRVRQRLIAEGQGNPLALLELPAALSVSQRNSARPLPAVLPLTRRLQATFAQRVSDLPSSTQGVLLLAALEGSGDLRVLRAAAGGLDQLSDLAPAERARLVQVDEGSGRLDFRHPLTRSSVVDLSTAEERRRAHLALADALRDQPERRAWHFAEAAVGPDATVAELLEDAAHRMLHRGDPAGAVAAFTRAADLSPDASHRGRLLMEAAYLGAERMTGGLRDVSELLENARQSDPGVGGSLHAVGAAVFLMLDGEGDIDTALRLLLAAIEARIGNDGAEDAALIDVLNTLLLLCRLGERAELWEPFYGVLDRLTPIVPPYLRLQIQVTADPARTAGEQLDAVEEAIIALRDEEDPYSVIRTAALALAVDRVADCREALWRVVRDGREGRAVTIAITAMNFLCEDNLATGRWDELGELSAEALEICDVYAYRLQAWAFRYYLAAVAACRGEYEATRSLTTEITRWAAPRRVSRAQRLADHARLLASLGRGDYEDAYLLATGISPAGSLPSHVSAALLVPMDLVESCVRTGRHAEAASHVATICDANIAALSPRFALLVAGAVAIAAPDHEAPNLFHSALALPEIDRWPFLLARVELCYGERLRRVRATTQSRSHLASALDIFVRLDAEPWAKRARNELRAAGRTTSQSDDAGPGTLTPQEHEIAALAAEGLSNKQIAQRLFLSHRTVGAHLYRVFPKLGITSRAALRDALALRSTEGH
jgi:DNA-binding CsgD family transcriptional regulator